MARECRPASVRRDVLRFQDDRVSLCTCYRLCASSESRGRWICWTPDTIVRRKNTMRSVGSDDRGSSGRFPRCWEARPRSEAPVTQRARPSRRPEAMASGGARSNPLVASSRHRPRPLQWILWQGDKEHLTPTSTVDIPASCKSAASLSFFPASLVKATCATAINTSRRGETRGTKWGWTWLRGSRQ